MAKRKRKTKLLPKPQRPKRFSVYQDLGDGWTAEFKLVGTGSDVRVGEARIFPGQPGAGAPVPGRGLTKKVLKRANPHLWLDILEEGLAGHDEALAWIRECIALPEPKPKKVSNGDSKRGLGVPDRLGMASLSMSWPAARLSNNTGPT